MLKYLRSEEKAARSEDLDTGTGTQALRLQSPHLPSLLVSAGSLWGRGQGSQGPDLSPSMRTLAVRELPPVSI